jgi:hypothetical protein
MYKKGINDGSSQLAAPAHSARSSKLGTTSIGRREEAAQSSGSSNFAASGAEKRLLLKRRCSSHHTVLVKKKAQAGFEPARALQAQRFAANAVQ